MGQSSWPASTTAYHPSYYGCNGTEAANDLGGSPSVTKGGQAEQATRTIPGPASRQQQAQFGKDYNWLEMFILRTIHGHT
eukprot:3671444-Pyramimonas_sp.AAC.1